VDGSRGRERAAGEDWSRVAFDELIWATPLGSPVDENGAVEENGAFQLRPAAELSRAKRSPRAGGFERLETEKK
jgi:hypothetical protein